MNLYSPHNDLKMSLCRRFKPWFTAVIASLAIFGGEFVTSAQVIAPQNVQSLVDTLPMRFEIAFPINSHTVYREFGSNATVLDSLDSLMAKCATSPYFTLERIELNGTASPDGRLTSNLRLAENRMLSIGNFVKSTYGIPDSLILMQGATVPWDEFREMIKELDDPRLLPIVTKGSDDSWLDAGIRMDRLKKLDKGNVWRRLATDIFPRLRRSVVLSVFIDERILPQAIEPNPITDEPEPITVDVIEEPAIETEVQSTHCLRSWHISINALEWALGITNLMGEYDFGCHWSVGLSVHYSGWNYFKSTRKFRTFIFRPEVRYWFAEGHKGIFLDAHAQMAAYNFSLPGWEYRIQDVDGKHPALGGGIGLGYRLPLGRNGRWAAEAAVGAGVYHLEYHRYVNEPNGKLVDTRKRTFFGIDNVAVSIVYNFNAFKK